jgi:hypothetical protein
MAKDTSYHDLAWHGIMSSTLRLLRIMSQQEQWQVAGNASEVYDEYLVPAVFEPWAQMLTALAKLQPGETV